MIGSALQRSVRLALQAAVRGLEPGLVGPPVRESRLPVVQVAAEGIPVGAPERVRYGLEHQVSRAPVCEGPRPPFRAHRGDPVLAVVRVVGDVVVRVARLNQIARRIVHIGQRGAVRKQDVGAEPARAVRKDGLPARGVGHRLEQAVGPIHLDAVPVAILNPSERMPGAVIGGRPDQRRGHVVVLEIRCPVPQLIVHPVVAQHRGQIVVVPAPGRIGIVGAQRPVEEHLPAVRLDHLMPEKMVNQRRLAVERPAVAEDAALGWITAVRPRQAHIGPEPAPREIGVLDHRIQRGHIHAEDRQSHVHATAATSRRFTNPRPERGPAHAEALDPRSVSDVPHAVHVVERPQEYLDVFERPAAQGIGRVGKPLPHEREADHIGRGIAEEEFNVRNRHRARRGRPRRALVPVGVDIRVILVLVERRDTDGHAALVRRSRLAAVVQRGRRGPLALHRDPAGLLERGRVVHFDEIARREAIQLQRGNLAVDGPSHRFTGRHSRYGV